MLVLVLAQVLGCWRLLPGVVEEGGEGGATCYIVRTQTSRNNSCKGFAERREKFPKGEDAGQGCRGCTGRLWVAVGPLV